jgi:cytoskeleton protein RodZ
VSLFQRIKTPFGEPPADPAVEPRRRSHAIGSLLRRRREELGLDLEGIGAALRIKPVYLAALEQGRAQDLPGAAYALGFIRSYADYLGLDSERVLDAYKAESSEVQARPDLALPVPLGERSIPGGPVLLVGLILALCGYGTWYYLSTAERIRPEPVAALPAALQPRAAPAVLPQGAPAAPAAAPRLRPGLALLPARAPSAAGGASPAAAGPASASPPPAAAAGGVAASPVGIDIRALADCWIQVRSADNEIVFSRVLKAGETYHVPRPGLFLRTGNAGALAIAVDGKPAPAIGRIGTRRRDVALDPQALLAGTAVHG